MPTKSILHEMWFSPWKPKPGAPGQAATKQHEVQDVALLYAHRLDLDAEYASDRHVKAAIDSIARARRVGGLANQITIHAVDVILDKLYRKGGQGVLETPIGIIQAYHGVDDEAHLEPLPPYSDAHPEGWAVQAGFADWAKEMRRQLTLLGRGGAVYKDIAAKNAPAPPASLSSVLGGAFQKPGTPGHTLLLSIIGDVRNNLDAKVQSARNKGKRPRKDEEGALAMITALMQALNAP